MKDNLFNQVKIYLNKKEEEILSSPRKQFTSFLLLFVFFYLLFTTITIPIENSAKIFTGVSTEILINLQGIKTSEGGIYQTNDENVYSFFIGENDNKKQIIISYLCAGVLEIIILISAILASIGISFKDKIVGILIGIIAGIIFNFIRVLITINIILFSSTEVIEFAHDFLFRLLLFLYIIIVYVLWFSWASDKENFILNITNSFKKIKKLVSERK